MKSYTDLNQARKLAEILPLESADMVHCIDYDGDLLLTVFKQYSGSFKYQPKLTIPCWSLAALLRELPDAMLGKDKDGYVVMVETMGSGLTTFALNPIDACVEMIVKLKELKLL